MNAVISLGDKKKTYLKGRESKTDELKRFFNVLDYVELSEDKSGIDEFEDAFIKYDEVTKRSKECSKIEFSCRIW